MKSSADIMPIFAGAFNLGNPLGTIYTGTHVQTSTLNLSMAGQPVPAGWALAIIQANGNAINIPGSWIKYGGDDISAVNAKVNHIQVFFKDDATIYYTNKVV